MNFYSLFDTSQDGVFAVTTEGQFVYSNEVFANLLQIPVRRITNKNIFTLLPDHSAFLDPIRAVTQGHQEVTPYLETDFPNKDGEILKVQISAQKYSDHVLVFIRNVHLEATLFEKYRHELGQKEDLIKQLARKVFELEFLLSSLSVNLGNTDVNIMRKSVFKKVHDLLQVKIVGAFKIIESGAAEKYVELEDYYSGSETHTEKTHQLFEMDIKKWRVFNFNKEFSEKSYIIYAQEKYFILSCAARTKSLDWVVYSFYFEDEAQCKANLMLLDSLTKQTNLNIENQGLFIQSITDEKTQLFNQRYLKYRFAQEVQRASRHGQIFALLVFDIDHFKKLNDTYGHLVGDQALIEVAQQIKNFFRNTDIAARFGGEEFVVLCLDVKREAILDLANRVREKIAALRINTTEGQVIQTSVSVGVAVYPEHGTTPEILFKGADEALYKAKGNGRNRVELAVSK